jgi:hypothetical protein
MPFVATHDVTAEDVTRAARLTTRWTDILLSVMVVAVLAAILLQVLYAFWLYLRAVTDYPANFVGLLRLDTGDMANTVFAWLSIIVTLGLPIFLFVAARSLAETIWPSRRVRRLIKHSNVTGPTTYTVSDEGVRATKSGGADTFMPWAFFDATQSDGDIAALTQRGRLMFFVPLAAFGPQREAVFAHIRSRIGTGGR